MEGSRIRGSARALEPGATDEEIVAHLNTHRTPKTPDEIHAWSDSVDKVTMHGDPERGEWFDSLKLGLDPAKTTLFEWLVADDRASYTP